ncbi:DNA-binding GntR family transcriptional regulator [Brevibacterium pityocampae]
MGSTCPPGTAPTGTHTGPAPTGTVPDARAIAEALAAEVRTKPAGARLESEHELCTRFGVARSVVRRALEDLERRFLIRRVRGSGTFVGTRIDYHVSTGHAPSLHSTVEAAGGEARTSVLESGPARLPLRAAELLGAEPGESTLRLRRTGSINGFLASCGEEWLAPGAAEHLDAALGVIESVYETLQAFGYTPRRSRSVATLDHPSAEIAEILDLEPSTPAWFLETVTSDAATGAPLLVSSTWLRLDCVRLVFDFEPEGPSTP